MRSRIQWLVLLMGLCTVVLAPSSMAARKTGTAATTGLLSVMPGRLVTTRVAMTGEQSGPAAIVQLDILDAENRVLATTLGELRRGQPLEVEFRYDGSAGPRLLVRGRAHVFHRGPRPLQASRPILSFEILNTDTGENNIGLTCPFPGSGFEFSGGCHCVVTALTIPAPSPFP
jgi:hypothetical protein